MAMNALQGVVDCLDTGQGEIEVIEPVRSRALGCIERMLDFVKAHPQSVAQPRAGFVPNLGVA
jgi:quinolinate synthase